MGWKRKLHWMLRRIRFNQLNEHKRYMPWTTTPTLTNSKSNRRLTTRQLTHSFPIYRQWNRFQYHLIRHKLPMPLRRPYMHRLFCRILPGHGRHLPSATIKLHSRWPLRIMHFLHCRLESIKRNMHRTIMQLRTLCYFQRGPDSMYSLPLPIVSGWGVLHWGRWIMLTMGGRYRSLYVVLCGICYRQEWW